MKYKEFPKWVYALDGREQIVRNRAEQEALGPDWADRPFPPPPQPPPAKGKPQPPAGTARTPPLRAAIYARGGDGDPKGEMQRRELRAFCARQGWQIHAEYVDTGGSGAQASRPQLDKLQQDATLRRFEVVVVWKLDRWGRSVADSLHNVIQLANLGIRFLAAAQDIDIDEADPRSRLLLRTLAAFAELERASRSERVRAGLKQHQTHVRLGRLGKDVHTRSGKDLPVGRPRRLFNQRRAAKLRQAGHSVRQIADALGIGHGTAQRFLAALPKP